ncbi:hypothetical protein GGI07_000844 [Coemansia sp. Benny D115]|nr:hypothetical protein GGI07_000844 [Coemansia sp. Benny D115]
MHSQDAFHSTVTRGFIGLPGYANLSQLAEELHAALFDNKYVEKRARGSLKDIPISDDEDSPPLDDSSGQEATALGSNLTEHSSTTQCDDVQITIDPSISNDPPARRAKYAHQIASDLHNVMRKAKEMAIGRLKLAEMSSE